MRVCICTYRTLAKQTGAVYFDSKPVYLTTGNAGFTFRVRIENAIFEGAIYFW